MKPVSGGESHDWTAVWRENMNRIQGVLWLLLQKMLCSTMLNSKPRCSRLKKHLLAADTLQREDPHVLFFINIGTHRVHFVGCTAQVQSGTSIQQQDRLGGILHEHF